MPKKVIIIGGGIAGLSAGVYLRMNGYDTEIFELHSMPGGVCTAWQRDGYTFDGCIHWLIGSGEGNSFHEIWKELHTTQNRDFVEYNEYMRVEDGDDSLTFYGNAERFREELMRIAPEDEKRIDKLIKTIRSFSKLELPVAMEKKGFFEKIGFFAGMAGLFPKMGRWFKTPVSRFINQFKNPTLRKLLSKMSGEEISSEISIIGFLLMMGGFHAKSGGYPIGGSLKFAQAIESYYRELGGIIHYRHEVEKILVEDHHAVGIIANGEEHRADRIISAADGYSTIYKMLDGQYTGKKIDSIYENTSTFPPLLQVSLGIAREFNDIPHRINFPVETPFSLDLPGSEQKQLAVTFYNFDPTMAPQGKTSAIVMMPTDNYQYWFDLAKNDREKYDAEKQRIAGAVIEALDKRFGDIRNNVEVVDVATPYTTYRYTRNWKASYEGWLPDINNMLLKVPKTLPGLKDFWMIGQWTSPGGGLPPAAKDGRDIAYRFCKLDRKQFRVRD